MRRSVLFVMLIGLMTVVAGGPAQAQAEGALDRAASALRSDPVYIDPDAERADGVDAERLRKLVRDSGSPIFLAVLPASATSEVGGDVNRLPQVLAERTGLAGTYGVVSGNSFRGGSSILRSGQAGSLATAAFQASGSDGTEAVLADFVGRVADLQVGSGPQTGSPPSPLDEGGGGSDSGGGSSVVPLVLLGAAGGGGFWYYRRKQARKKAEDLRNRSVLEGQLSVLAEDVVALDPLVTVHPAARPDYDAAVSRYRVAEAALGSPGDPIDLVKLGRLLDEGQYAMSRARAIVEGREPPAPPAELTRPGRRGEPPLDLDEQGQPAYVGNGSSPFYGGGWFGGGGGLMTGLFLGQMLGGGWGGHGGDTYIDNSGGGGSDGGDSDGGDSGGGDSGGGDWGGGFGGGDFGGGFGGGDFGGGDIGGGDWG